MAAEILKAGYRQLSLKYHPDKGEYGGEEFKLLKEVKERLETFV